MVSGSSLYKRLVLLSLGSAAIGLPATHPQPYHPALSWELRPTNTTFQFRGLASVSGKVAWVSGTKGSVLRTCDGGTTWLNVSPSLAPENSSDFEFRDIQAWDEKRAVILSIGNGNLSRIYSTHDGGESWDKTFVNDNEAAFYDCMAFENKRHGIALSDPVDGKFRLAETWDGGSTWSIVKSGGIPAALTGEFGFAASGTCIEAAAGRWYIASGGIDPGRIYFSNNGHQWKVTNSSIAGGAAAGVFSVRFRDERHGIAVGGDYEKPNGTVNNAAWSRDGGRSWQKAETFLAGYRSGASWVPGWDSMAVAVGTTGSDVTFDCGKNWNSFDNGTFDAVECVSRNVCWASGARGRVGRLQWT